MPMIDKIGILLQEMLEADLLIICLEERWKLICRSIKCFHLILFQTIRTGILFLFHWRMPGQPQHVGTVLKLLKRLLWKSECLCASARIQMLFHKGFKTVPTSLELFQLLIQKRKPSSICYHSLWARQLAFSFTGSKSQAEFQGMREWRWAHIRKKRLNEKKRMIVIDHFLFIFSFINVVAHRYILSFFIFTIFFTLISRSIKK